MSSNVAVRLLLISGANSDRFPALFICASRFGLLSLSTGGEMNSDDSNGAASEASSGVYRVEADGETGVPYATLTEATSEPPMDPEAQVYGRGGCLAQASHERAVWLYTGLGAERLRLEHDVRRCA